MFSCELRFFRDDSAQKSENKSNISVNNGYKRGENVKVGGLKVTKDPPGDISGTVGFVSGGSTTENDRKKTFHLFFSSVPRGGTSALAASS